MEEKRKRHVWRSKCREKMSQWLTEILRMDL